MKIRNYLLPCLNCIPCAALLIIAALVQGGRATAQDIDDAGFENGLSDTINAPAIRTPEDIAAALLQNELLRTSIHRAFLENERFDLENRAMALELRELRRFIFQLRGDERLVRRAKAHLTSQRGELLQFMNGKHTALSAAKTRACMQQLGQSAALAELLRRPVSSVRGDEFVPTSVISAVLMADGSLVGPPTVLLRSDRKHPLAKARTAFEACWASARAELVAGRSVDFERHEALVEALARWQDAAKEVAGTASVQKLQARRYFEALACLTNSLTIQSREKIVRSYLQTSGFEFTGGVLADLVRHVLENELSVRYGSEPQLAIAGLGRELVAQIDSSIASLDELVEVFKGQNPARKSAPRILPKSATELTRESAAKRAATETEGDTSESKDELALDVTTVATNRD